MEHLIGRQKEIKKLKAYANSNKSEFVAIYGRRRVGKTYLIREVFDGQFSFQVTGLNNATLSDQLGQFHAALTQYNSSEKELRPAKDWLTAFRQLITVLETKDSTQKKIVFLDELPWLGT